MVHYIENDYLKVGVKDFGAELTSVKSKKSSFEFLWQGDPNVWGGQSPILFPIVGRLIDDKYTLNGTEYEMPKHGFARKMKWFFESATDNSITFKLSETADTLKIYPYQFDFFTEFSIDANQLAVKHRIINKADENMYFSLGAHPAFNCEIGDKLRFSENETLDAIKIDLEKSLRLTETYPVLKNEKEIIITKDIFAEDALIFKGVKSKHITLLSDNHHRMIKFNLGNAPYLGIWAKPGAPYVCIEPWYGVNDSHEKKSDFSQKDAINTIGPKGEFEFTWRAEFYE